MPDLYNIEIPKPASDEEFQNIILDLFKIEWNDDEASIYGRNGQRQYGIDIISYKERAVIQCKLYNQSAITKSVINKELNKFNKHNNVKQLVAYKFAVSCRRDAKLQDFIFELNTSCEYHYTVSILFWEDIELLLAKHRMIFFKYYNNIAFSNNNRSIAINPGKLSANHVWQPPAMDNITNINEANIYVINTMMSGDYLSSYLLARNLMNESLNNRNFEGAALFLSSMINNRRGLGQCAEALSLLKQYSHSIGINRLPIEYRLRILKEKLAIAHDTNQFFLAFSILDEITLLDPSGISHPQSDNWLPGIVLWRHSHLLATTRPNSLNNAILLAKESLEWFKAVDSPNKSGLAIALLNLAWLNYLDNNPSCLEQFRMAASHAAPYSKKSYFEARIGEGIAALKFHDIEWDSSVMQVLEALNYIETTRCGMKNYSFLGKVGTPKDILISEIESKPSRAFSFISSIINR